MQVGTSTSSGILQVFTDKPVYYVFGNDVNIEYIKSQLPTPVTVKSMAEWNKDNIYLGKHLLHRTQDHHYFNLKTVIQDKSLIICGAGVSNEDLVKCVNHLNQSFQKKEDLNIVTKGSQQQREELLADEESLSEKSNNGSNSEEEEEEENETETEDLIPIKHSKKRQRRSFDFEAFNQQKDLLRRTQYRLKIYKKTFEYASSSLEEILQTRLSDYTHGSSFEKQKVQRAIDEFMEKQNQEDNDVKKELSDIKEQLKYMQSDIKEQLKYMQHFNTNIFKTLIRKQTAMDTVSNNLHTMLLQYPSIVLKAKAEDSPVEIKESQ